MSRRNVRRTIAQQMDAHIMALAPSVVGAEVESDSLVDQD